MIMENKLKLEWVTDVIKEDYKNWNLGDVVTIQAQTGTGKTYFVKNKLVPYLEDWEEMLIVANRINLKRQLKNDLFDYYNTPIPTTEDIDDVTKIGNVTIMSYQQIAEMQNGDNYNLFNMNLNKFKYIVCDECHFFLSDASFNNKCDLAFEQLIIGRHTHSIKIFISATIEEIEQSINKCFNDSVSRCFGSLVNKNQIHKYSTGVDYSYLDITYFKKINDIISTIKNDESENKWLIFINSISNGTYIIDQLTEYCAVNIITKDTNIEENDDLKLIINQGKFKSKVLICTKAMDNGINIQDELVKNIVIDTYDKTTFIQELGRIRVDINNPYTVNLYINTKSYSSFNTLLNKQYLPKQRLIDLYNNNINEFNMTYSRNYGVLPKDIFILNDNNDKSPFDINILGYARLIRDIEFCELMKAQFELFKKYAFILEQLSWIERDDSFSEFNLMEDVVDMEIGNELKLFLESAFYNDDRFTKEYFINEINEIIERDNGLKNLLYKTDNGKTRTKGSKKLNELFRMCGYGYIVGSKIIKETVNGKRKNITYWTVIKED